MYRSNKVFCFQCVMQSSGLRHVYRQIKERKPSEQGRKKTFPTPIYAKNSVLFQRARASRPGKSENHQKTTRKTPVCNQKTTTFHMREGRKNHQKNTEKPPHIFLKGDATKKPPKNHQKTTIRVGKISNGEKVKTEKQPQDRTMNGDLENGCVDVFWDGLGRCCFSQTRDV